MNHNPDLFGHVLPEPEELPRDKQLTDLTELIGHTVKLVFEGTDLKTMPFNADAVIVTETGCFIALKADDDDLFPVNPYRPEQLGAFVTTHAMARSGLMGQEQVAIQRRKDEIARVAELRNEAADMRRSAQSSSDSADRYEAQAAELEAKLLEDTGGAA